MEILHYKDPTGDFFWMEIRSKNFWALKSLETEYQKKGSQTYFNLFSSCEEMWSLTIRPNVAVAA